LFRRVTELDLIAEIKDGEPDGSTAVREAARVILFDSTKIAIVYVGKHGYHKLPGGGLEKGEDRMLALRREVMEETGCEIEVLSEVGRVFEFRSKQNMEQISYCYMAQVSSRGEPQFTPSEVERGFSLMWLEFEDAMRRLESDVAEDYSGSFIVRRDFAFLKRAKEMSDRLSKPL